MQLFTEYSQLDLGPIHSWARLVLPGSDLPHISNALQRYIHMPWHLSRNTLYQSLISAADMAAHYFDKDLSPQQQKAKHDSRYALFEKSIEDEDGSLFFIRDGNNFYGYTRVMPVSNKQWQTYFEDQAITEAEFSPCQPELLEEGKASIYFQALVFPEFTKTNKHNKRVLQEAGFAGLIGQFLPDTLPQNGIDVYFTAFHPYTENLAKRLNINEVGRNKHGHKIYGFNVSENSPKHSLGSAISGRIKSKEKAFSRFNRPHKHSTRIKQNILPHGPIQPESCTVL